MMNLIFLLLILILNGCSSNPVKDGAELTKIKTLAEIAQERKENWEILGSQQAAKRHNN